MRYWMDFRSRAHGLGRGQATFGIDQMRSEYGVDESRFAQPGLPCRSGER